MAADAASPENAGVENSETAKSYRRSLLPAIVLTILWLGALAVLSLWTANPATVNRTQILQSQFILTGRVVDPKAGSIEILSLKRIDKQPVDQTLLNQTVSLQPIKENWSKDAERIFPVVRNPSGNWHLAAAPIRRPIDNKIPEENYIDYPDTESINKAVDHILNQRRKTSN